jgi:hypothetical protein
MSDVTITGTFANIIDAQNTIKVLSEKMTGENYYWTNAYAGNPGIRSQVWGTMGTVYGGQIGTLIGNNMDFLIAGFNNAFVAPYAASLGVYQPYYILR